MPSPNEESAPRKPLPPRPDAGRPGETPSLVASPPGVGTSASLPSAGGRSAPAGKFTPKYVPRLINYLLPEYQDESWRQ